MKKDDIYKLIEFDGIYNDKVKKNLRDLIKKYHPDKNKKDKKTIQIIYEVKKELENNYVSYKSKKDSGKVEKDNIKKKNDFISEEECLKNIFKLSQDESNYSDEIKKLYDDLSKMFKDYRNTYRKFCLAKNKFCELEDKMKNFKRIYLIRNIIFIILSLFLIISLINSNIISIIIGLAFIVFLILWSYWYNRNVDIVKNKINKVIKDIEKNSKEISVIQNKIKELSENIRSIERKNTNVKNDIRFYKNMKNK